MDNLIENLKNNLINNDVNIVFTGAGISVESGIKPFRGENGLWNKYDEKILDINYYYENPKKSWKLIKDIFYNDINKAKPNKAHKILSKLENKNLIDGIITQNIDNLHFDAGSKNVLEFHGNSRELICVNCKNLVEINKSILDTKKPICNKCKSLLKPNFTFFGESLDQKVYKKSIDLISKAETLLIIGTTGVVQPAANLPYLAYENGAKIIEINPKKSAYTDEIVDIFIKKKATKGLDLLEKLL